MNVLLQVERGCTTFVCNLIRSLSNYDIACYTLEYLTIMAFLVSLYYRSIVRPLTYTYYMILTLLLFMTTTYQLLLYGDIYMSVLPISLKILITSLVGLIILMLFNKDKNIVIQQPENQTQTEQVNSYSLDNVNIKEKHTNGINYTYTYNNDAKYSEPNTTNAKTITTEDKHSYNNVIKKVPLQHEVYDVQRSRQNDDTGNLGIKTNKEQTNYVTSVETTRKQENVPNKEQHQEGQESSTVATEQRTTSTLQDINPLSLQSLVTENIAAKNVNQSNHTEELEELVEKNRRKFKNAFQDDSFQNKLAKSIEIMIRKVEQQKTKESEKINEIVQQQEDTMKDKYLSQLREFEKQLNNIDGYSHPKDKEQNNDSQETTAIAHDDITMKQNNEQQNLSNVNDVDDINIVAKTIRQKIIPGNVADKLMQNKTTGIDVVENVKDIEPEDHKRGQSDVLTTDTNNVNLSNVRQMINQSIEPLKEQISKLETNVSDLNTGMQGIVDRVSQLLDFITSVMRKNS